MKEIIYLGQLEIPQYISIKGKKDAFAMIRQLGFPSLFISQSCAETKWPELLRSLDKL